MTAPWPLSLAALHVWPLRIPLHHPLRLASETITHAETLIIEAQDDEGRSGWGEASAAPTMTGEVLAGMAEVARRYLGPALLSAPFAAPAEIAHRLDRAIRSNTGAKCATEAALLDLAARRAGLPLCDFLGQRKRDTAPCIAMIGGATDDAVLEAALAAQAQGFRHIKVKLGLRPEPRADAAMIRRLRAALGPQAHLSGDANMAWTLSAAREFLAELPEGTLDYLEQPLPDDDKPGLTQLAARTTCPICIDEGLHHLSDIPAYRGIAAGFGLKSIKLGGLLPTLAADALAREAGMRTTLACKIAETAIGNAAALHLSVLAPEMEWGLSLTHGMIAADITETGLPFERGSARLPRGAGIGVDPDRGKLATHAILSRA
ncbi:mandelate racemase/muconate lactonizing enzyme family protein [Sediminicoccus sp. BL-A-41-H5]|uniref:mandelate racemase/muconate lactonizing enzyme family protein n=1 Tax=Sediminicoccus sp. BL-A-41-H5 TaxID=3421106 RepID=UPI003D66CD30